MPRKTSFVAFVLVAFVAIASGVLFACSETPTSVPVRTFERAQRMDAVCLRLYDTLGNGIVPEGLPQDECAPVPPTVNGSGLQNQLFAVVTQSTRGEVALVDLSAGFLIDQKNAIPGINFIPVGALPTDVAAAPDGRMVFVAAAEPNKPAIYGLPSHRLLGDKSPKESPDGPGSLASWPVCALPQRPGALTIVPRPAPIGADAGSASDLTYELVAVLPGDRLNSAKVVTIDPRPFLRATPRPVLAPGATDFNDPPLREPISAGPALRPGILEPCPITSAIELANGESVPTSFTTGPTYSNGVDYTGVAIDGGPPLDVSCDVPTKPTSCGAVPCRCLGVTPPAPEAGVDDAGTSDAGDEDAGTVVVPLPDGGSCDPSDGGTTQTIGLDLPPLDPPLLVAVARDNQTIFVADGSVPFIHVVDLSTPSAPRELPPYLATSMGNPSSVIAIKNLAVSPPTRDFKRYMYGVDANDGSLIVFDVTDVATAPRTPMLRPNPELNPFQPPDRVAFNAPVVAVAFARHDFPLSQKNGVPVSNAASGVLCNPSDGAKAAGDPGSFYVANGTDPDVSIGPARLRGIFAFATLSNGSIVALDVDDWDAPCRRPASLDGQTSSLAPVPLVPANPAPYTSATYPWQPNVSPDFVTKEDFYPVSPPHRLRSTYFLRDDPSSGRHIPYLSGNPVASANGAPLPLVGQGSEGTPRIHPVASITGDRSESGDNGVRFSFEVPDVHFDQDWTVTYEGALPGFDGFAANLTTTDDYWTLRLTQAQASFCAKGVEDYDIGQARAAQVTAALAASGFAPPTAALGNRTADYVQVIDDVLPSSDPYWTIGLTGSADPTINGVFQDWSAIFAGNPNTPQQRFELCANTYGSPADQSPARDFPILQAFDDHLVLGRFFSPENAAREIIAANFSNQGALRLMRRCFHDQIGFRIRAASEWVTVGSVVGFLNHTTREASGRCVLSCDPRDALLNGRSPAIPADLPGNTPPIVGTPPARNSVLALRNPAISFFIQNGTQLRLGTTIDEDRLPARDTAWQFATRGQFQALAINLAAQTSAVNPQSMRFIETLGQIAVVDAASQGLVLIDLSSVRVARAPYF